MEQFGTSGSDSQNIGGAMAISKNSLYLTGYTDGSFPNFTNLGSNDIFLKKYDRVLYNYDFENRPYNFGKLTFAESETLSIIENFENNFTLSQFEKSGEKISSEIFSFDNFGAFVTDFKTSESEKYLVGKTFKNPKSKFFSEPEITESEAFTIYQEGNTGFNSFAVYWNAILESRKEDKTSDFGTNSFILKLDENNSKIFYHIFGSENDDTATALTLDTNLFVAGVENMAGYLQKYERNGTKIFEVQLTEYALPKAMVTDESHIFIASEKYKDILISKVDKNSSLEVWTRQFGTESWETVSDIKLFGDEIYILGNSELGDGVVVLARFNKNGERKAINSFGTEKYNFGEKLILDEFGNPTVLGFTENSLNSTNSDPWQIEWNNLFVKKMDKSGEELALTEIGVDIEDQKYLLFVDGNEIFKAYFEDMNISQNSFIYVSEVKLENESSENGSENFSTDGNSSNGKNSLVKTSNSETCENGGIKIETGLDLNSDGVLQNSEVTGSSEVCNGTDGSDGQDGNSGNTGSSGNDGEDGASGTDGKNSLVKTSSETSCENGGIKIETGLDLNSDGVLQNSEVTGSSEICNGTDGSDGQDGNSGNTGSSGNDGEDGASGTDGKNSLVKTSSETSCENGGIKIETGLDLNSDGVLQNSEVTGSSEICNGTDGSDGQDGNSGNTGSSGNIVDENLTEIEISEGWNLIAINTPLSKIPDEVSLIWQFDLNWSAYSPNGEFSSDITSQGVPVISENLSSKDGTWFFANSDTTLKFEISEEDGKPEFPNLSGKLGWNLMGTDRTIPAQALSCSEGEKGNVWKYVDRNWLLSIDGVDSSLYPNMFEKINAGQGFWLQCQ
jgi:hypothetical protein